MDGVSRFCGRCGVPFQICRRCWREQRYCGQLCSQLARRQSLRLSQKKYAATLKGKKSHSARQKTYRRNCRSKNTETDQSTKKKKETLKPSHHADCCHVCGGKIARLIKLYLLRQQGRAFGNYFSFRRTNQDAFT